MSIKINPQRGSTLAEALIYLALFSFIITATLLSTYQILTDTNTNAAKNDAELEAAFIIAKINWALTDNSGINSPTLNGSILDVTKYGGTRMRFELSGDNITFKEGSAAAEILNSEIVKISSISFARTTDTGTETVDSITSSFYVDGKKFETTNSIR